MWNGHCIGSTLLNEQSSADSLFYFEQYTLLIVRQDTDKRKDGQ